MAQFTLGLFSDAFRRVRTTNSTDSAFPARTATTTEPTGQGIVNLSRPDYGQPVQEWVQFLFYGTDAANETFDARILGWRKVITESDGTATALWVPTIIAQVACTLSTFTGVSGAVVTNTEFFCDTLAVTLANTLQVQVNSQTNDTPGNVLVNTVGYNKLEVLFDMGTAASGNALIAQR